jgi:hypothetical protein
MEAKRVAAVLLCSVPQSWYIALSFCYRLRARAEASDAAAARRTRDALKERVLMLRSAPPQALTAFDVGVNRDLRLTYRSGWLSPLMATAMSRYCRRPMVP